MTEFTPTERRVASNSTKLQKAEERGEISPSIPRGVLSEDGLYNALDRLQDVLGQMSLIVNHVTTD